MPSGVYLALLRGINVGGRNTLLMKDLAPMFTDAGCENVRTYIQSGNVVFEASRALATKIPAQISDVIAKRFGLTVPVVVRSSGEIQKITENNPLPNVDPKRVLVAFLAKKPSAKNVALLDPDRSPPDEFFAQGSNIYLHCPKGFARSKFNTGYFDSKLETISTIRGWPTVLKLHAMAAET